jgi:predicted amidohydrolase YtcJ
VVGQVSKHVECRTRFPLVAGLKPSPLPAGLLLPRLQVRDALLEARITLAALAARLRVPPVILENGVVRTLDPSLPAARALAIVGDRIAGGVGTHETALASPERVDLGGRCVLPGFNDAHVHFPSWSLARDEVRLEGTRSLDEALARVRDAAASSNETGWLRGRGWRSGDWSPEVEPTKEALDAVTGPRPVALQARDGHSLWLNSAALARAKGDLQVPGGVVEFDERGEPTGVLR